MTPFKSINVWLSFFDSRPANSSLTTTPERNKNQDIESKNDQSSQEEVETDWSPADIDSILDLPERKKNKDIEFETKNDQPLEQVVKTDWSVDVTAPPKLVVPSFIRLFVIRRILGNYIDEKDEKVDIGRKIYGMVKTLKDDRERRLSFNILNKLWKDGLDVYICVWYQEKQQATVIEMIFNDIILVKFGKEYEEITRYLSNSDSSDSGDGSDYNQCLVFNTNDLMYLIFQFLNFWDDKLYNCSLVNSHWLCQIWNSNSLSCVDLTYLIKQTMRFRLGNENMCTRMWQRIVSVKHIKFSLTPSYKDSEHGSRNNMLLLNRLSMLANIERIECRLSTDGIGVLKTLMQTCCNKIDTFIVDLSTDGGYSYPLYTKYHNTLPPLKLIYANFIDINNLYFYIIWSHICKTLILKLKSTRMKIVKSWCQHVIDKCDSSGIKSLTLDRIEFEDFISEDCEDSLTTTSTTKEDTSGGKLLLLKLAQQFKNVEDLKLLLSHDHDGMNDSTSYFLTSLCKIVSKNNGKKIEIGLGKHTVGLEVTQRFICTNNIKVDVLSMYLNDDSGKLIETIGTQMNDLKCIKIKWPWDASLVDDWREINFDQIKTNCKFLPSIQVVMVEVEHDNEYPPRLSEINEFLNSKVILQWALNDILIICDIKCKCNVDDSWLISSFENLFAFLYQLLIEQGVLIDIRIEFIKSLDPPNWVVGDRAEGLDFTQVKDKYWSYFNRNRMIKEYQPPQLNEKTKNYYQSMINPVIKYKFTYPDKYKYNVVFLDIRVANACLNSL